MISMSIHYTQAPDQGVLDVLAVLSDRAIRARVAEMACEDELTLAMRQMFRAGVNVDTLSAATGLTPREVRRRLESELNVGDDLAMLAGYR